MYDFGLEKDYYKDPTTAAKYLGHILKQGSLSLTIGAGASAGLGLPSWITLVQGCLSEAGLADKVDESSTNIDIMKAIDRAERKFQNEEDYYRAVHDTLYKDGSSINFSIFNSPLLVSIGALLNGGKRGSVREVLNFNFDSILEYYLALYGTQTDVVFKIPCLRKDKDVTIYHPHGYLPLNRFEEFSDFLILSKLSYDKRLGKSEDQWKELSRDFFRRKISLFIGLSGADAELMAIVSSLDDELNNERPTGFWLFGHPVDEEEYLSRNIIPIILPSVDSYPEFLLSICQEAAK